MKHTANAVKLAGAVALAGSSQAYGQIIPITGLSLPKDINSVPGMGNTIEYYNATTGVTSAGFYAGDNLRFEISTGSYIASAVIPLQFKDAVAITPPNGYYLYASALSGGTKIGSDVSNFSQGTNYTPGVTGGGPENKIYLVYGSPTNAASDQQPNTPTYLGFQFADALGNVHDAYLQIETTYDPATSVGGLKFLSGAYNSVADNGSGSGDITTAPEPGTLSFLVLGAAALSAVGLSRRRRSFFAES